MKNKNFFSTILLALAVCFCVELQAQLTTPAPSPLAKVTQSVGLGEVSLVYSRPGKKGRAVMGNLVPYGKVWRTGANRRTQIHFSEDVKLEGVDVAAGKYAMLSIPGKESWTIILSDDLNGNPGTIADEETTIKFDVKPQTMEPMVETFTIDINDIKDGSATINIVWENTWVPINLTVDTDSKVMASIDKTLAGPSAADYYQAGSYMYSSGKDMQKALEYVEKGMKENEDRFWVVTMKARILAKMGEKEKAMEASKMAIELAEKAGNGDYVKINQDLMSTLQ
ncbi:MAG: DUF2911 domain-containing protein [Bacteroidota bacterium]